MYTYTYFTHTHIYIYIRISCYIIHASLCWVLTPPEIPSWARPVTTYVHPPAQIRAASAPQATRRVRWIGLEMSWIDLINVKKSEMSRLHDQNIWDNVRIVRRYRQSKEQQADVFFEGVVIPAERLKGSTISAARKVLHAQSFGRLALEELQCPELGRFHGRFGGFAWTWEVGSARAWTERCHQQPEPRRNICRFSTDR